MIVSFPLSKPNLRCCCFWFLGKSKPLLTNRDYLMEGLELFAQRDLPSSNDTVRTAAVLGFQRFNSATPIQPGQGGIEGAWFKLGAAELEDIFHYGVAMLWAVGQAGQDQQGRVRKAPEFGLFFVHERCSLSLCIFTLYSITYYVGARIP